MGSLLSSQRIYGQDDVKRDDRFSEPPYMDSQFWVNLLSVDFSICGVDGDKKCQHRGSFVSKASHILRRIGSGLVMNWGMLRDMSDWCLWRATR